MRICLVGPGIMSIPPKGWGGVEALIWNYKLELEKQGHEVKIQNTWLGNDLEVDPLIIDRVIADINDWNPDFVHLHYDHYADIMPRINSAKAITSHYPYLDYPQKRGGYEWIFHKFCKNHSNIFTLSKLNSYHFSQFGAKEELLWEWIYGVNSSSFSFDENALFPDKTICLGKIEPRKQQFILQSLNENIEFAGPLSDPRFKHSNKSYLGTWTRDQVYNDLTKYANMILFSDGEAAPQVTAEALLSGIGLVVSVEASANLDGSLPFIDIVNRNSITSNELKQVIKSNRENSLKHRKEIRAYGLENFDISKCVKRYTDRIQDLIKKDDSI